MLKELKNLLYFIFIFLFIFLIIKYYFSDINKKNSYRSIINLDNQLEKFSINLNTLKNDTQNIIEYVETSTNKNKKTYRFWELLTNDEK